MSKIVSIGIRCFTNSLNYVILSGSQTQPEIENYGIVKIPKQLANDSEEYSWLRKEIIELITTYPITNACVKIAERSVRKPSLKRAELEAIIKEAIYSHLGVICVPRLKSQLKRDINDFDEPARYIGRVLTGVGLEELSKPAYEDATVASISELPA